MWRSEDHNLKRRLLNSCFTLLQYIIYILTVTVSYGRIYSVYQTQRVEVIGEKGEECGTTQLFIENLNLVMCATTDTKYNRVLTTVLRVITGTKHHREEHLLGYYAQDIRR